MTGLNVVGVDVFFNSFHFHAQFLDEFALKRQHEQIEHYIHVMKNITRHVKQNIVKTEKEFMLRVESFNVPTKENFQEKLQEKMFL